MGYNAKSTSNGQPYLPPFFLGLLVVVGLHFLALSDNSILVSPLAMSKCAWDISRQKQELIANDENRTAEEERRVSDQQREDRQRDQKFCIEKDREKKRLEAERLDDLRVRDRERKQRLEKQYLEQELARERAKREYDECLRRCKAR